TPKGAGLTGTRYAGLGVSGSVRTAVGSVTRPDWKPSDVGEAGVVVVGGPVVVVVDVVVTVGGRVVVVVDVVLVVGGCVVVVVDVVVVGGRVVVVVDVVLVGGGCVVVVLCGRVVVVVVDVLLVEIGWLFSHARASIRRG